MELNTQPQRLQALLDGYTLTNDGGTKYKIIDGEICYIEIGNSKWRDTPNSFQTDIYSLYIQPQWYETAVSGKTLIWARDSEDDEWSEAPYLFNRYIKDLDCPFQTKTDAWKYAKQLTKAEVMEFLENAAEVGE